MVNLKIDKAEQAFNTIVFKQLSKKQIEDIKKLFCDFYNNPQKYGWKITFDDIPDSTYDDFTIEDLEKLNKALEKFWLNP